MACRGFLECILKLLNFLMTLAGLAMVGYGIYLFVEYKESSSLNLVAMAPGSGEGGELIRLGRPFLSTVSLSTSIWDDISSAWFLCVFVGVGVLLFIISCFGCIGASTRNGCCLSCYALLVILLVLIELGCAAFMFFDSSWESDIPTDSTGYFDTIYDFLKEHWSIAKWVALGIVVFEAVLFLLALLVRAANTPEEYDSDEEFINPSPRQSARQPLINRPPPATVVPVVGAVDQRTNRSDAWSSRMREKYGLDTSEFTYNPNEPGRPQQVPQQQNEERGRCTIM